VAPLPVAPGIADVDVDITPPSGTSGGPAPALGAVSGRDQRSSTTILSTSGTLAWMSDDRLGGQAGHCGGPECPHLDATEPSASSMRRRCSSKVAGQVGR